MTFCPLSKNCQLENELISVDYTSKVGEKQFSDVRKGLTFKIEVHCMVCKTDLLAILRSSCKVCHRTQQRCGCLKDEEQNRVLV